jgi:hypothetical protein
VPPSPPTSAEKKRWLKNSESHSEISENESPTSSSTSSKDPEDPQYPYEATQGPGHPDASEQELKIMHDMLKERGMKCFRLDFTTSLTSPVNKLGLEVARDIFLALLECNKYEGLQPEECQPDVILNQLRGYAHDRLARK